MPVDLQNQLRALGALMDGLAPTIEFDELTSRAVRDLDLADVDDLRSGMPVPVDVHEHPSLDHFESVTRARRRNVRRAAIGFAAAAAVVGTLVLANRPADQPIGPSQSVPATDPRAIQDEAAKRREAEEAARQFEQLRQLAEEARRSAEAAAAAAAAARASSSTSP
jgi:hypothetical protein